MVVPGGMKIKTQMSDTDIVKERWKWLFPQVFHK